MIVYPAIDIRNGKCVRLLQGAFDQETVYSDDPVAMAQQLVQKGAQWIHVVDLDGARTGVASNLPIIQAMVKLGAKIELGGGIRSKQDFTQRMECGVARCVLGTAAIEDPALVRWAAKTYPGRVAVGIDAKNGKVAVKGWEEQSTLTPLEVAKQAAEAGVRTVIYTEIANDGMQNGPDIAGSVRLMEQSGLEVIVSGGVGCLEDVSRVKKAGLPGVIIGKAMYDGRLEIERALQMQEEDTMFSQEQVKYNEQGLVPVIAQDVQTGAVLMQAYMNQEALSLTLEKGHMVYWSRSRQELWEKGATSGQIQELISLTADCDGDCLLAQVVQKGGGACHTGAYSCFFNEMTAAKQEVGSANVLYEVDAVIKDRREHPVEGSYTNYLFTKGIYKILKKVGEESAETIIAAKNNAPDEIIYETSDLFYHVLVMLQDRGVALNEIFKELKRRR